MKQARLPECLQAFDRKMASICPYDGRVRKCCQVFARMMAVFADDTKYSPKDFIQF